MRNHLNRLPLRWQLTLAYGAAVALVLTGTGVFVYVLLAAELDHDLERNLRAHSAQISGLLERSALAELPRTPGGALEPEESFAQVVRPDGTVVIASAHPEVRLLSEDQLTAVLVSELLIDRPAHGAVDSVRLLASPVHTRGQDLIVVVGTSG